MRGWLTLHYNCYVTRNKRPLSVTIIGFVYIAVGVVGLAYHAREAFQYPGPWIVLVRFLAIVSGVFMLRGHNWARWLAVAWIAFHVILSAFNSLPEFAMHAVFCAVIAWLLFRPQSARYFRLRLQQ